MIIKIIFDAGLNYARYTIAAACAKGLWMCIVHMVVRDFVIENFSEPQLNAVPCGPHNGRPTIQGTEPIL